MDMLEYQVVGESAFRVVTYFGLGFIVVNQELDYEQIQSYRFRVSCILYHWSWSKQFRAECGECWDNGEYGE